MLSDVGFHTVAAVGGGERGHFPLEHGGLIADAPLGWSRVEKWAANFCS